MRSLWKTLFLKRIFFYSPLRELFITKKYIGKRVYIPAGKKPKSVLVRRNMISFRFGEFAPTKILGSIIHIPKKKKRKKKKRK